MQTIRTLIVDDEARIRRGIERMVLSCGDGWEIAAAVADGMEALEYLDRSRGAVDLLITDVRMPEMDGLTLIKEAKKKYSFYPLLISGYDDFEYLQTALREGALDYLLKPVDREQFRHRLTEIRAMILNGRLQNHKLGEMEREAEKWKISRQVQALSYITSTGMDLTSLGYWVDDFPKGRYVLLYLRLDTLPVKTRSYTAKDWQAYSYALENIVGEVVGSHFVQTDGHGWCWRGADSDFWVLAYGPDSNGGKDSDLHSDAYSLSSQIRTAVHTYTPFSVSVAYGDVIEDLILLPDAKRQSLGLMKHRLLQGGNRVFRHPVERGTGIPDSKNKDLSPLVQKLKRSVEQANAEEAAVWTRQLFEELDRFDSPAHLHNIVQNVIILIHSAGLESSGAGAPSVSLEDELLMVKKAAHFKELRLCVNQVVGKVIRDIRRSRETGNVKPVERAKIWIKQNLGDDITIKKLADQVYMNPTYFSEYFKMHTGETVLDYLTRMRIERAKQLLHDQRLRLQEVSSRVGYLDVKYFSRLFKQWTGQTPSKFREQLVSLQGEDSGHGNES